MPNFEIDVTSLRDGNTMSFIVGHANRGGFHQHFKCSFYACRSQKWKNTVKLSRFFKLLGSARIKAAHKMLMKLTPDFMTCIISSRVKKSRINRKQTLEPLLTLRHFLPKWGASQFPAKLINLVNQLQDKSEIKCSLLMSIHTPYFSHLKVPVLSLLKMDKEWLKLRALHLRHCGN